MAEFIQKQPSKGSSSSRNRGGYDDEMGTSPQFNPAIQRQHEKITSGAQSTISDIDALLAEEQAPSSQTQGQSQSSSQSGGSSSVDTQEKASVIATARRSTYKPPAKEELEEEEEHQEKPSRRGVNRKLHGFLKSRAAKRSGIAAIGGGVATGGLLVLLNFVPLKWMHVVTNLHDEFSAASNQAGGKMGNQLLGHYLIRKVIPGMHTSSSCNSTHRSRSCANVGQNDSPVAALFHAWKDNNLEGRLANDYGFEIVKQGDAYFVRSPRINGDLDLGRYSGDSRTFDGNAFARMNRADVRAEFRRVGENETLRKRAAIRYNVIKLLARKYGIRSCIVACDGRDNTRDKLDQKKRAFKLFFVERVVLPRSQMLGLALGCALADFDCTKMGDSNADGQRETNFQRDVRVALRDYRRTHGTNSMNDLDAEREQINKDGVTKYLIRRMAGEATASVLGKIFGKAIPIIGWLDGLSSIYELAQNAGPAIKHMNYVMNTATAVHMATMMLTNVDEQKAGEVDYTVQGSMIDSLHADPDKDHGGGPIEDSPLYDQIFEDFQPRTASLLDLVNPRTYAQGTYQEKPAEGEPRYVCHDGRAPSETPGQHVCPEVGFGTFSLAGRIAITISEAANNPALSPVSFVSQLYQNTLGKVFNWVEGLIGDAIGAVIPDEIKEDVILWIRDNVIEKFFIEMIGESANPAPARILEVTALGMETIGNDTARLDQGGQRLTEEQNAAIYALYRQEKLEDFKAKPLYARLFDENDSMSMMSRIAFMMPTTRTSIFSNLSAIVTNPLGTISSAIPAGIFSGTANAYQRPVPSFSGVPTYGYPLDHEVFQPGWDPEKYWKDHNCDNPDLKTEWGEKWGDSDDEIDETTLDSIALEAEPCFLLRSEVAAGGAQYDTSLLQKDPEEAGAEAAPGGVAPVTGDLPQGTSAELARQIVTSPNIIFQTRQGLEAFDEVVRTGAQVACGKTIQISPTLLGVILKLSQSYKLVLGVFAAGHGCDGGRHPTGAAVDINGVNPLNGGVGTGNNIRFESSEMPILRQFYDTAGQVLSSVGRGGLGQVTQCITPTTRYPNVTYFDDSCNHIHLDVRSP